MKLGVSELANVSERRVERLVNTQLNNGLPAFLSPEPGLQSGAMIMQYAAASLVSTCERLVNTQLNNGLPAFLSPEPGLQSGAMIMQYAAASLVSENKTLANKTRVQRCRFYTIFS